jgi:hypothetical protein
MKKFIPYLVIAGVAAATITIVFRVFLFSAAVGQNRFSPCKSRKNLKRG